MIATILFWVSIVLVSGALFVLFRWAWQEHEDNLLEDTRKARAATSERKPDSHTPD